MKCLICRRSFYQKKSLSNILKKDNYLICNSCYKSYPLKIDVTIVPLNRYDLKIYSIYPKNYCISPLAFSYEYSRLFNYVFSKDENAIIFPLDKLRLNETFLAILDDLSTFYAKDINIICNYMMD